MRSTYSAAITAKCVAVKRKLKMLQYRPQAIDGCLAGTGLTLDD